MYTVTTDCAMHYTTGEAECRLLNKHITDVITIINNAQDAIAVEACSCIGGFSGNHLLSKSILHWLPKALGSNDLHLSSLLHDNRVSAQYASTNEYSTPCTIDSSAMTRTQHALNT